MVKSECTSFLIEALGYNFVGSTSIISNSWGPFYFIDDCVDLIGILTLLFSLAFLGEVFFRILWVSPPKRLKVLALESCWIDLNGVGVLANKALFEFDS